MHVQSQHGADFLDPKKDKKKLPAFLLGLSDLKVDETKAIVSLIVAVLGLILGYLVWTDPAVHWGNLALRILGPTMSFSSIGYLVFAATRKNIEKNFLSHFGNNVFNCNEFTFVFTVEKRKTSSFGVRNFCSQFSEFQRPAEKAFQISCHLFWRIPVFYSPFGHSIAAQKYPVASE